MISRFLRHIKEGFFNVKRNSSMSGASIVSVTVTLVLVSIFSILSFNTQNITQNISNSLIVFAKIEHGIENWDEIEALENKILMINDVESIEFSNREEQLEILSKNFSNFNESESVREENPLHHAFIITLKNRDNIDGISKQVAQLDGIKESEYGGDGVLKMISVLNVVQIIGSVLVIILCIMAILLISNTISVTIYARKEEIAIMRTVGAKNGFIRAPFLVEGMLLGFIGAVIPILLTIIGYNFLYSDLGGIFFTNMFELVSVYPFVLFLSGILLLIGMLVGLIGSFISVTRYLRWKR